MAATDYDQLSMGDLGRRLTHTVAELVEKQVELAKQEAREDLRQNVRAAIWLGIAAALLLFATVCLLVGLIVLTGHFTRWGPGWAALLWLVIFAIAGAVCALKGKGQLQTQPLGRTRTSVKEDLEWAKQRLKPHAK